MTLLHPPLYPHQEEPGHCGQFQLHAPPTLPDGDTPAQGVPHQGLDSVRPANPTPPGRCEATDGHEAPGWRGFPEVRPAQPPTPQALPRLHVNVPPQPAISAGPPASTPALLQALAPTHHCWGRTESSWGKPSVPRLKASKPRPGVSFRHRLLSGQHAGVPGTLTSPQSWFHTREAGGTCRLPRLPQWGLGQEPSTLPLLWPVTARGDSGR